MSLQVSQNNWNLVDETSSDIIADAVSGFKKLKEQYEEVQLQLDESRQMHIVIVEQLNEQLTKAQSTKNEQGRVEQFKKLLEEKVCNPKMNTQYSIA